MEALVDYIQELNVLAVLVAAMAAFISGAVWYAEPVFGKQWMKEVGLTKKDTEKGNMPKVMGLSFASIAVTAAAIGVLVQPLALTSALQGASFGVLLSVSLVGMNKLMQSQFEQRSGAYWVLVLGADALAFGVMGAILAVWR